MNRKTIVILLLAFLLLGVLLLLAVDDDAADLQATDTQDIVLPDALMAFVGEGMRPIALESADLNQDGISDYLLVLEPPIAEEDRPISEARRPLLVLTGQADETYSLAARSELVILNALQGGVMGDPFVGIQAEPGSFTVKHYGGSAWRWTRDFTFDYSADDKGWYLSAVSEVMSNVHTGEESARLSAAPADFDRIRLDEFDPEDWEAAAAEAGITDGSGLCIHWSSGDTVHLDACQTSTHALCTAGKAPFTDYDLASEVAEGPLYTDAEGGLIEFRTTSKTCHALAVEMARMAEGSMSGQWGRWVYSAGLKIGDKAYLYGESVTLYAEPDPDAKPVSRHQGQAVAVRILEQSKGKPLDDMDSGWFKVALADSTGWVWGRYLHPDPQSAEAFIE